MQQGNTITQPPSDGYFSVSEPPKQSHEGWKSIVSTLLIILIAPLIALFLTAYVFQSYEVEGPSMETTLQNGDRLVVLKTGKTLAKITGNQYIPKRADIIIFEKRDGASVIQEGGRQLIKRVIGLPGDRVVVKDGKITVYNDASPNGFNPDEVGGYLSNVPTKTPGNVDITVGENEIFVCGDNRNNSLDSRSFGTVSSKDIIGRLALRLYPFSKFESF